MVARDSVAITGSVLGLLSAALGWLTLKSSRVAGGISLSLPESFDWAGAAIITALWITCLLLSLLGREKRSAASLGVASNLILISTFLFTGLSASNLLAGQAVSARVSPGAGFWVSCGAAYILIFSARRRLSHSPVWQNLVSWVGLASIIVLLLSGWLNNLSIMQEFLGRRDRFLQELVSHIFLFGGSVIMGTLIGIPLGLWAAHSKHAERPAFFIANITQTIPSLVLFGLLIAPLSALSFTFPALRQLGIRGVGTTPAMIALIIYSLLPIVRNTFAGMRHIDTAITDAGYGMGMSRSQVLRRLEMPLAAPLVLEGVRTASVQAVGNTAVAALIGAGGLGAFIFQGLGQAAADLIILGAIPIIILALLVDALMRTVVWLATPKGLAVGNQ